MINTTSVGCSKFSTHKSASGSALWVILQDVMRPEGLHTLPLLEIQNLKIKQNEQQQMSGMRILAHGEERCAQQSPDACVQGLRIPVPQQQAAFRQGNMEALPRRQTDDSGTVRDIRDEPFDHQAQDAPDIHRMGTA